MPYISWLEEKHGGRVMNSYEGEGVEKTSFTTRNYQYVYSRNRIKGAEQEKKAVKSAELQNMELLSGIFSRYVLGGMTKGVLWAEAVENGIFLEVLYRLRELLEI